jgi:hypothetical protein
MKVSDVISRARYLLNDTDPSLRRWEDEELILWTDDAQRAVAVARPDSSPSQRVVTLTAGTKQATPEDCFKLMDVVRNVAQDGLTPGRAIRMIEREVLDQFDPSWHTAAAKAEVRHFTVDDRSPNTYFVYPPALAGTKIEVLLSQRPATVDSLTDDLAMADMYFDPIVDWVMYRSYGKDTEYTANPAQQAAYLAAFANKLGVKLTKDNAYSAIINRAGGMPNTAAVQLGGVA